MRTFLISLAIFSIGTAGLVAVYHRGPEAVDLTVPEGEWKSKIIENLAARIAASRDLSDAEKLEILGEARATEVEKEQFAILLEKVEKEGLLPFYFTFEFVGVHFILALVLCSLLFAVRFRGDMIVRWLQVPAVRLLGAIITVTSAAFILIDLLEIGRANPLESPLFLYVSLWCETILVGQMVSGIYGTPRNAADRRFVIISSIEVMFLIQIMGGAMLTIQWYGVVVNILEPGGSKGVVSILDFVTAAFVLVVVMHVVGVLVAQKFNAEMLLDKDCSFSGNDEKLGKLTYFYAILAPAVSLMAIWEFVGRLVRGNSYRLEVESLETKKSLYERCVGGFVFLLIISGIALMFVPDLRDILKILGFFSILILTLRPSASSWWRVVFSMGLVALAIAIATSTLESSLASIGLDSGWIEGMKLMLWGIFGIAIVVYILGLFQEPEDPVQKGRQEWVKDGVICALLIIGGSVLIGKILEPVLGVIFAPIMTFLSAFTLYIVRKKAVSRISKELGIESPCRSFKDIERALHERGNRNGKGDKTPISSVEPTRDS